LNTGDLIHIKGHTTDIEFVVSSMQIDKTTVSSAKAGDAIGTKVSDRVRPSDIVYKFI
jgi:hypothetical protein